MNAAIVAKASAEALPFACTREVTKGRSHMNAVSAGKGFGNNPVLMFIRKATKAVARVCVVCVG